MEDLARHISLTCSKSAKPIYYLNAVILLKSTRSRFLLDYYEVFSQLHLFSRKEMYFYSFFLLGSVCLNLPNFFPIIECMGHTSLVVGI